MVKVGERDFMIIKQIKKQSTKWNDKSGKIISPVTFSYRIVEEKEGHDS